MIRGARGGPEIMGRVGALGRQDVGLVHDDAGLAGGAGRCRADLQVHAGRGVPAHVEPVVGDHLRRIDPQGVGGRRHAGHPPVRPQGVAFVARIVLAREDHPGAGETALVDELDVAEVHQVVDAILEVRRHRRVARDRLASRRPQHAEIGDRVRIGLGGLTSPKPDDPVPLHGGPGANHRALGDRARKRIVHADAGGAEGQPVVAAADQIPVALAAAERGEPVGAAVFERRDRPIGEPIEQHRRTADSPSQESFSDFVGPGGHAPGFVEERIVAHRLQSFLGDQPVRPWSVSANQSAM